MMRRSHLLRAGFETEAAFLEYAAAFAFSGEAPMPFQRRDDSACAGLREELIGEYAKIIRAVEADDTKDQDAWGADFVNDLVLDDNWSLDARIAMIDGRPRIALSRGLLIGIEDALLNAFSIRGFFTDRPTREARPDGFAVVLQGADETWRYQDYSAADQADDQAFRQIVTRRVPIDPVRLAQVDLILHLAIRWVALHEQAHYLLGHLDLLQAERGIANGRLDEVEMLADGAQDRATENYCLELQADALATQLLFTGGLSPDLASGPAGMAYLAAVEAHKTAREAFAPGLHDREGMFRTLLLASSVAPLLFELRRERMRRASASHPPPSTRLLNICSAAATTYADIVEYESGAEARGENEYDVDHVRPALNGVLTVMIELEMMSHAIRLDSPWYRSELLFGQTGMADDGSRRQASPLAEDFFRLLRGRSARSDMQTEGARLFIDLLDVSRDLHLRLEPYTRVHGFR